MERSMSIKKFFATALAFMLIVIQTVPTKAWVPNNLDSIVDQAAVYVLRQVPTPQVGSIGGEWAVIGLARSGHTVPNSYFSTYASRVEAHVRSHNGVLHNRRLTEYSRIILALTAIGYDPTNVAGFDLTLSLSDFDATVWQGINGPIFALLAFDSLGYDIPQNPNASTQATRELFVNEILRRQTSDGGFNLTAGTGGTAVARTEVGDPDITGMALQALANYQDRADVRTATNNALRFLSRTQLDNGGFASGFANEPTLESSVQVLVALASLGIPLDDPRFVKNGNTVLDNVLSFRNPNGSFRHSNTNVAANMMATEQALYGLVAAQRLANGGNRLYDMTDVVR
jgi:hypothetical protein